MNKEHLYNYEQVLAIAEQAAVNAIKMYDSQNMNLENLTPFHQEGEDMGSKRIKQKIKVGQSDGKSIYKWIDGYSNQQVLQNAARVLLEFGVIGNKQKEEKPKHPFKPYALNWLKVYKEKSIRHTTYSEYVSVTNKHLIPQFGDVSIQDINTSLIQQFLNKKASYAKKTVHQMILVLSMILEGAVQDNIIQKNPARSKRLKNPATAKSERIALTQKQVNDIISHIDDLNNKMDRRYMALLCFTGMRREQVLALKWQDIDFEKNVIHVRKAITFKGNAPVLGQTKTQKGKRDIPMHSDLPHFLTHDKLNEVYVVNDHITQSTVKRMWQRIKRNINVYNATPHCFRHTFATICRRSGMDEKVIQKIGGWSDVDTLRNVYTHVQDKDIETAGSIIEGMFNQSTV